MTRIPGKRQTPIRFGTCDSPLGPILVARSDRGVCAILFGDSQADLARELQRRSPHAQLLGSDPEAEQLAAGVVKLIETPGQELDRRLDIRGTVFQRRVWQALRDIPSGTTASYGDIARGIGAPRSIRAVAQACGANPLAVAIPCHRVIRGDGTLSGYHWGVDRKRALLEREASA